jgi:ribonuclease HI
MTIMALYVGSGLIGSNPSAIGATYAIRLVHHTDRYFDYSGVLPVWKIEFGGVVTNNQAEMYAMLEGLRKLPEKFAGTIYCRSNVALGRVFKGWKWTNIPSWMHLVYTLQRKRLVNWSDIKYLQLEKTNEHAKWCDQACQLAGDAFMATVGQNIPTFSELPVEA